MVNANFDGTSLPPTSMEKVECPSDFASLEDVGELISSAEYPDNGIQKYQQLEGQSHIDLKTKQIAMRMLRALSLCANINNTDDADVPTYTIFADPKNDTINILSDDNHSTKFRFEQWKNHVVIHSSDMSKLSVEMRNAINTLSLALSGKNPFSHIINEALNVVRKDVFAEEYKQLERRKIFSRLGSPADKIASLDAHRITLNGKKYIGTSNPSYNAGKFWAMVLDEKSPVIVKLNEKEEGYYPAKVGDEKSFSLEGITVKLIEKMDISGIITVRHLDVEGSERGRRVIHIDFAAWPDFSVPSIDDFMTLLNVVNSICSDFPSELPLTVHCGAGWGRTGTFITLHSSQNLATPDFPNIITQLRQQRSPQMVENEKQYIFINDVHDSILDHLAGSEDPR